MNRNYSKQSRRIQKKILQKCRNTKIRNTEIKIKEQQKYIQFTVMLKCKLKNFRNTMFFCLLINWMIDLVDMNNGWTWIMDEYDFV